MRNKKKAGRPSLEHVLSAQATGDERLIYLLAGPVSINDWMAVVCADERAAHRECNEGRFDGRQTLAEYFDLANTDREDRYPHEAGYEGRWEREARQAREAIAAEHDLGEAEADAAVIQLIMRFADEPVAA